jgi:hypothetical protein
LLITNRYELPARTALSQPLSTEPEAQDNLSKSVRLLNGCEHTSESVPPAGRTIHPYQPACHGEAGHDPRIACNLRFTATPARLRFEFVATDNPRVNAAHSQSRGCGAERVVGDFRANQSRAKAREGAPNLLRSIPTIAAMQSVECGHAFRSKAATLSTVENGVGDGWVGDDLVSNRLGPSW